MIACLYCHTDIVSVLIEYYASVNEKGNDQSTPLVYANSDSSIPLLLKHRADVNGINRCGLTALHSATKYNVDSVKVLLNAGARVNARTLRGETPLVRATECRRLDIVQLLLVRLADPTIREIDGRSAWELANYLGYAVIQSVLSEHQGNEKSAFAVCTDQRLMRAVRSFCLKSLTVTVGRDP